MEYVFLISRIIFGGYWIMNGWNHLAHSSSMTGYTASKGVPAPKLAIIGSGLLILLGGLGILLGMYVSWAVLAIVVFLVPVTFMMHDYWRMTDPNAKMMEQIMFGKNMALLGAALAYLFIPTPWIFAF